jgi:hypothetical protein
MERKSKNIKISEKHHTILKDHCNKSGLKMYRVVEKWIESLETPGREKDIYGED